MIILLNNSKELVVTKSTRIHWKETGIDVIRFLIPQYYEDIEMENFTFSLSYVNPSQQAHLEILELLRDVDYQTPDYYCVNFNDASAPRYLQYVLPVDTSLTNLVGDITMELAGAWYDPKEYKQHVIHSSALTITVDNYDDYFALVPDSALFSVDQKLMELNNVVSRINNTQTNMINNIPNGLAIDEESKLHLTVNGEPIDEGVEIPSRTQEEIPSP